MTVVGKSFAVALSAVLGMSGAVGLATSAHADVLDQDKKRCGQALVTATLERDGREREIDVEVYSNKRGERWRIIVRDSQGDVLTRINRKTNREGEFDVWRYLPTSTDDVTVRVRGPQGTRCTIKLSA